jgi:hypothetical protein
VRRVGWVLVGVGLLGAAAGHYVAYHSDAWADTAGLGVGGAAAALGLVIVGLLILQIRS